MITAAKSIQIAVKKIGVELSDSILDLCIRPGLTSINPVEINKNEIREILKKSM